MAAGSSRDGIVRDAAGRPVAGALVEVARGTAPTPEIGYRTDANGRFRISLPPGRFTLRAVAPDAGQGETDTSGGPGGTIEIDLSPPG
jgi:hypothetical protein